MKPKIIHQQAMEFSFKAKQAYENSNYGKAFEYYKKAAEFENQVAEFYFDKPELEPTRSIIIRSAAFLNLKAGLIETAQKFIFFGLLNIKDELIKTQLNDALELSVSLKNMSPEAASGEYNHLNMLRQRSIHYILEPTSKSHGNSVSLEMIKDFTEGFLKSIKAFANSSLRKIIGEENDFENVTKDFERLINPLVTSSAYGSFKFSIANDFLQNYGERKEFVQLKSNIIRNYHNEIFINPLTDSDIDVIRERFNEEEVNSIFRPLMKIKANNTPYKIGYYDTENFNKIFMNRIINKQRKKLLTIKQITQEDIGELENSIIHKSSSQTGKITKKTILKEQLKSYEFDLRTNHIESKDKSPLILNEEILINIYFNSENGFNFSFDDFRIEHTDVVYDRGLHAFYNLFYNKIMHLHSLKERIEQEQKDWDVICKLIGNIDAL